MHGVNCHGHDLETSVTQADDCLRPCGDYWNIYWVSRSTKTQKQITNHQKLNAYVRYPAWSPLKNQIVYEYAENIGNIWLMELKRIAPGAVTTGGRRRQSLFLNENESENAR